MSYLSNAKYEQFDIGLLAFPQLRATRWSPLWQIKHKQINVWESYVSTSMQILSWTKDCIYYSYKSIGVLIFIFSSITFTFSLSSDLHLFFYCINHLAYYFHFHFLFNIYVSLLHGNKWCERIFVLLLSYIDEPLKLCRILPCILSFTHTHTSHYDYYSYFVILFKIF